MQILVDGYNVTKSDPATSGLTLREQRDNLIARLRVGGREILGKGQITVVFDGQPGVGESTDAGSVRVRYSSGETADEYITAMAARVKEQIVLVTDDRGLRSHVQAVAPQGVECLDRSLLFEGASRRGRTRQRGSGGGSVARDSGLPPGANKITRELKELWLDEE